MVVLVYVENTEGKFKQSAFEAISYAAETARLLGIGLSVISIGKVDTNELEKLGSYGAVKVLNASPANLNGFVNQAYSAIIAEAAKLENSKIIILSNTFSAKGLAPRIATKLSGSFGNAVVALPDISSGKFVIKRNAFSGKAFAYEELTEDIKIISLVPNSYGIKEVKNKVIITEFSPSISASELSTLVKDIVRNTDKISLADADRVVSAGRGMKGPENWKMIEEFAEVLGAATACSKPVSDAGWRPHSEHVGQTGITISPSLYIAIGISGAIQHLAGVSSSKVIVVINKDPEAPFFKVADYGIVGDAFEVIPKLIEAVKSLKS